MATRSRSGLPLEYGDTSPVGETELEDTHPFRFGKRDHLINLAFWTLFGAVTAANLLSNELEPMGNRRAVPEAVYRFLHS